MSSGLIFAQLAMLSLSTPEGLLPLSAVPMSSPAISTSTVCLGVCFPSRLRRHAMAKMLHIDPTRSANSGNRISTCGSSPASANTRRVQSLQPSHLCCTRSIFVGRGPSRPSVPRPLPRTRSSPFPSSLSSVVPRLPTREVPTFFCARTTLPPVLHRCLSEGIERTPSRSRWTLVSIPFFSFRHVVEPHRSIGEPFPFDRWTSEARTPSDLGPKGKGRRFDGRGKGIGGDSTLDTGSQAMQGKDRSQPNPTELHTPTSPAAGCKKDMDRES
eukprot:scaffold25_cov342-Pavlova_lutheri.AAC.73